MMSVFSGPSLERNAVTITFEGPMRGVFTSSRLSADWTVWAERLVIVFMEYLAGESVPLTAAIDRLTKLGR